MLQIRILSFTSKKQLPEMIFLQITIPPGAYEIESLNFKIKRIFFDKSHYNENDYPCTIKPNFSTLGSIMEISPQRPLISFVLNDSTRNLLGFHETIIFKEYHLSPNPVDILSFDNTFLECDTAKGMIFKRRRSGIIHSFTMDVDHGYKCIEKFRGGITWFMTESRDVIASISFKVKYESNDVVSFNGQSMPFRLSIK